LRLSGRQRDFAGPVFKHRIAAQELDPQSPHASTPPLSTAIAGSDVRDFNAFLRAV
jgi:hypothetical protein